MVVASVLAAAACSSGLGTTTQDAGGTALPTSSITLKVADYEQPTVQKVITQLENEFTKQHPKIKFTNQSGISDVGEYATQEKLAVAGPNPPDIVQVGQAQALMGPLVKAHLLTDMSTWAREYHWANRFGPGLLDELKMEPDGKTLGTGGLYGVSLGGNLVGIFYNREKLKALGYNEPPKTLAEFEQMMAKAKAAGQVPIEAGNLEKWPGVHYLHELVSAYCPAQQIRNWVYGKAGATVTNSCDKQAVTTLASWAKNGYFSPSTNGTANADAITAFAKGTGVFCLSGSWSQAQFDQQAAHKIGFFALPGLGASSKPRAAGALTPPYAITSKSNNKAAAAAFLNFMISKPAASKIASVGTLPTVNGAQVNAPKGSTLADVVAAWRKVLAANGLTLYPDWSTPSMLETVDTNVQLILGGKLNPPTKILTAMQQDWSSFH